MAGHEGFDPARDTHFLKSLNPGDRHIAAAWEMSTFELEHIFREPFFAYPLEIMPDGSFGMYGKRVVEMIDINEPGGRQSLESLLIIEEIFRNRPDITTATYHSRDIGYGRDYVYKFHKRGDGQIQAMAIEYQGGDEDRKHLRRLLSNYAVDIGDTQNATDLYHPLFYTEDISLRDIGKLSEQSYVSIESKRNYAEYRLRMANALINENLRLDGHKQRVEQWIQHLQHVQAQEGSEAVYREVMNFAYRPEVVNAPGLKKQGYLKSIHDGMSASSVGTTQRYGVFNEKTIVERINTKTQRENSALGTKNNYVPPFYMTPQADSGDLFARLQRRYFSVKDDIGDEQIMKQREERGYEKDNDKKNGNAGLKHFLKRRIVRGASIEENYDEGLEEKIAGREQWVEQDEGKREFARKLPEANGLLSFIVREKPGSEMVELPDEDVIVLDKNGEQIVFKPPEDKEGKTVEPTVIAIEHIPYIKEQLIQGEETIRYIPIVIEQPEFMPVFLGNLDLTIGPIVLIPEREGIHGIEETVAMIPFAVEQPELVGGFLERLEMVIEQTRSHEKFQQIQEAFAIVPIVIEQPELIGGLLGSLAQVEEREAISQEEELLRIFSALIEFMKPVDSDESFVVIADNLLETPVSKSSIITGTEEGIIIQTPQEVYLFSDQQDVARFSFLLGIWWLKKVMFQGYPPKNDFRQNNIDTLYTDEDVWILLSIIWYLAQIREQRSNTWQAASNWKKKKAFPRSGIIYMLSLAYAGSASIKTI